MATTKLRDRATVLPDSVTPAIGPDDPLSGRCSRCSKTGRPAWQTLFPSLADAVSQPAGLVTQVFGPRLQSFQSVTHAPGPICYPCTRIAPEWQSPVLAGKAPWLIDNHRRLPARKFRYPTNPKPLARKPL